ncbi:MAG TPA: hypothetical protein VJI75_05565 [Candidatus Nanoarchaeia archaeon]|nr:hypothetical protein [Candidatus Nanoarchaeia archaeon]
MSIAHKRIPLLNRGRNRKQRPKTFASEEAAKRWATAQGLKGYYLVNLKSAESAKKKIRIEIKI